MIIFGFHMLLYLFMQQIAPLAISFLCHLPINTFLLRKVGQPEQHLRAWAEFWSVQFVREARCSIENFEDFNELHYSTSTFAEETWCQWHARKLNKLSDIGYNRGDTVGWRCAGGPSARRKWPAKKRDRNIFKSIQETNAVKAWGSVPMTRRSQFIQGEPTAVHNLKLSFQQDKLQLQNSKLPKWSW